MDTFQVETMQLSMRSPETGNCYEANLYTVDSISRKLSIGELVMAICLQRAAELEEDIVTQIESMSRTTVDLETLTAIQEALVNTGKEKLVDLQDDQDVFKSMQGKTWYRLDSENKATTNSTTTDSISDPSTLIKFLTDEVGIKNLTYSSSLSVSTVVQSISSRMDNLNSVNQKDMITLQSTTNKRDQSYDLISNMCKSLNTVLVATANNYAR